MSHYAKVDLTAADLGLLAERYLGLRFTQVRASWFNDRSDGDDRFDVSINVAGPAEDLLRHGFILPEWTSLPPCGVRAHRTDGFGWGKVKRRKSGGLLVHGCYEYELGLDKIAPVLTARMLERFKRGSAKSP